MSGFGVCALLVLLTSAPALPPRTADGFLRWLAQSPPDQVVTGLAAVLAWLSLGWLGAGVLLLALGRLPGWLGELCYAVGERLTPRVLRRVVEAALGTALAGGSLAVSVPAGAAVPATSAPAGSPVAAAATAAAPPDRNSPDIRTARARISPDGWPDLDRPAGSAPAGPVRRPDQQAPGADAAPRASSAAVTVAAGDTLWRIAGRALGGAPTAAEIAAAWPRWYAANRAVIGPDPDDLVPGQSLRPPREPSP